MIDEWLAPFRWPGTLIVWLSLSLIAGLVGPFGTYGLLDLPRRLLLWGGVVAAAFCLGAMMRAVVRLLPGVGPTRWASVIVALAVALVLTPLGSGLVRAATDATIPFQTLAEIAATLFFATIAVCALSRARSRSALATAAALAPSAEALPEPPPDLLPESPPEPRLLRRLDPALRARLISISVRDHYVDVVTQAGRASLLMRLSDAMAETEGEAGAQIHRSHWVARHAARALERNGARQILVLADGSRLPISRAQRAQIDDWTLTGAAPDPDTTT